MRKRRLHLFSLIVGSIIAFAITFSQYLGPELSVSSEKAETEQTENDSPDESESFISLPSFSLPAPVHVQVNLDPHCVFEFFFEEDVDENHIEDERLRPDRFFETLFRFIISPNAP